MYQIRQPYTNSYFSKCTVYEGGVTAGGKWLEVGSREARLTISFKSMAQDVADRYGGIIVKVKALA